MWIDESASAAFFSNVLSDYWLLLQVDIVSTPTCVPTVITGAGITSISVTPEKFEKEVFYVVGDYTFLYNGSRWTVNGNPVVLSSYGITLTGQYVIGDSFSVAYNLIAAENCNISVSKRAR